MAKQECYFSFDEETTKLVKKLGYIPEGCYCTPVPDVFIAEHAEKNKDIVAREIKRRD
jgi:hypothetical protein